MQIKTAEGTHALITNAEALRMHKMMNDKHARGLLMLLSPRRAYDAALNYKDKASHNIKRIGCLKNFPLTLLDVKDALLLILLYGCPALFVDAIALVALFQAARVVMHSLKHAVNLD